MKRVKLNDRVIPTYSKGEEIFNMVSHIVGGALGILAIIFCVIISVKHNNYVGLFSGIVFGLSLIILYTMSSIYHGLSAKLKAKKVFQIIDHCTIFLLIAGTYTPFCLGTLMDYSFYLGFSYFIIIWIFAILGIVLNAIDLKRYKVFSMICYIVMGWCVIFRVDILIMKLGLVGFLLLLFGGLAYTVGVIFYGLGNKKKWLHSVFHIFCVIGSLLHFFCILFYVL